MGCTLIDRWLDGQTSRQTDWQDDYYRLSADFVKQNPSHAIALALNVEDIYLIRDRKQICPNLCHKYLCCNGTRQYTYLAGLWGRGRDCCLHRYLARRLLTEDTVCRKGRNNLGLAYKILNRGGVFIQVIFVAEFYHRLSNFCHQ